MQEQEKNNPNQLAPKVEDQAQASPPRRFWDRLRRVRWSRAISWLFAIPWSAVWNVLIRFSRRRLLPVVCWILAIGLALGTFALIISSAVCNKTADRILTPEALAAMDGEVDCILVLGCMVYPDGRLSHMLSDRVETAVGLYHAGVSSRMLMSGDHQDHDYNEVDPMREAAIASGVPAENIEIDALGLSTYDSIARIAEQYRGRRVVIVTQRYHLFRAIYIAEKMGIDAYGVSADLRTYRERVRWEVREVLARCKDVYYTEARLPAAGMSEVSD